MREYGQRPQRGIVPISRRRAPLVFVLALLVLAPVSALASAQPRTADDAACAVPAAIAGDGLDDRVAIQNALTSQKCAFLPAGVYDIDSIQPVPPARRPFMMLDAPGAELYGEGVGTVLEFRGLVGAQDWEGIRMTGVGATVHDLSIDTAAISGTNEQTHAIRLIGPATDAEISHVTFNHPIRAGAKSGDCVQLVGVNDGREIARVKIHDNEFVECDRSGVAAHSGTTQLEIVDNRFSAIGNTDLDFEGTGGTSDVLVKHNTFTMSPGPHGLGAMQLQLVDRARVTENVFEGRGMEILQADDAEIDHNTIRLTQTTTASVILVAGDSARTHIHDNLITRDPSAGAGPLISATPRSAGTPDRLEIDGNILVQPTSFHLVSASGLVGLYVRGNVFLYSGAAVNEMGGVRALGSSGEEAVRTTDLRIESNRFDGPLRAAVVTSGSLAGAGTLDTADNIATGPTFGIFCDNQATQGRVLGPVISRRDEWSASLCGPAGFVTVIGRPTEVPDPPTPPDDEPPVEEPPDEEPPVEEPPDEPPVEEPPNEEPPVEEPPVEEPPDEEPPVTGPPVVDPGPRPDPGGGMRNAGGTPLAPDTTAPVLGGVSLSPPAVAASARRKTVLRFSSTEPGTLSILIERLRPGRKITRTATLTQAIQGGPGSVALSAKRMKPGRYRLSVTASDAAGNRSEATLRMLTVLAG
ncbi:MAG TPA: right-handed parallel beta-helix repeat-containing protein [Solirubrobacterales bacterium]